MPIAVRSMIPADSTHFVPHCAIRVGACPIEAYMFGNDTVRGRWREAVLSLYLRGKGFSSLLKGRSLDLHSRWQSYEGKRRTRNAASVPAAPARGGDATLCRAGGQEHDVTEPAVAPETQVFASNTKLLASGAGRQLRVAGHRVAQGSAGRYGVCKGKKRQEEVGLRLERGKCRIAERHAVGRDRLGPTVQGPWTRLGLD